MESSPNAPHLPAEKKSTLIEFPGISRNSLPEWRKELSERVREVQERRAREAAHEAVEAERRRMEAAINPPQLELLPPAQMPAMNPLVAAALKRIERAHQTAPSLATAIAYAPEREENDMSDTVPTDPQLMFEQEIPVVDSDVPVEKAPHLTVIATPQPPKRLIKENDPALNYLDSIARNVRVDDLETRSASAFRRLLCAVLDLIFCALLTSPIGLAMRFAGADPLQDVRAMTVLAGSAIVVMFLYLTLMTGLTGRTWAMRLLSLRVIDTKTGLIPTGGQSIGRSIFYLMTLATGVGILLGLLSREGYMIHDRFTRTAVIRT
jgi:uncharacterized RDD family membrane protein YckC